jgi:hypothetical protein
MYKVQKASDSEQYSCCRTFLAESFGQYLWFCQQTWCRCYEVFRSAAVCTALEHGTTRRYNKRQQLWAVPRYGRARALVLPQTVQKPAPACSSCWMTSGSSNMTRLHTVRTCQCRVSAVAKVAAPQGLRQVARCLFLGPEQSLSFMWVHSMYDYSRILEHKETLTYAT